MLSRYELIAYADDDGGIDPARVQALLDHAANLGDGTAQVEYVEPIPGSAPPTWGLRILVVGE